MVRPTIKEEKTSTVRAPISTKKIIMENARSAKMSTPDYLKTVFGTGTKIKKGAS